MLKKKSDALVCYIKFTITVNKKWGKLSAVICLAGILYSSPAEALVFSHRFDSWQTLNGSSLTIPTFRRNQEFAFETEYWDRIYARVAYNFTSDVTGPTSFHEWTPLTARVEHPIFGDVNLGINLPYTSSLGQPSIVWSDKALIVTSWLDLTLRVGFRGHNGTWMLQPVVKVFLTPWLTGKLNNGRVVDHLLDQYPDAELVLLNEDFPVSTAIQYMRKQITWQISLHERWRL